MLRGIFILLGAAVIERFTWVFYIFGAFLVYTAINLVRHRGEDEDYEENAFIRRMRKVLPITPDFHGSKIRVEQDGRKYWTPMIVVFLALGTTDLLFALDSIPAIFGLTREPFIVFTANVFALMGLRQLYFLLGGLLKRLVYLSLGLAVILAFIGVKLVLEAVHENSLPFINGGRAGARRPVDPDLAVADGDPGRAGRRDGGEPAEDPGCARPRRSSRRPRGRVPRREARLASLAMRPTDLALLRVPGVPAVSPDGRMAVVAVTRPDLDADEYRSQLWAVPTDGSASARPLTAGTGTARRRSRRTAAGWPTSAPSPAGSRRSGCCRPPGGEPRRLTDHHLGAGAPVVVAGLAAAGLRGAGAGAGPVRDGEGVGPGAEPPRLITTLQYRRDGVGFLADRPSQVFVLDLPADFDDDTAPLPEPVQVTTGDADCVDVTWRPDGAELAFVSARHPRADVDLVRDVYAIARRRHGAAAGDRLAGRLRAARLRPRRRGSYVTAVPDLGPDGVDFVARQAVPCRVDAAGGALRAAAGPGAAPPRGRDAGDGRWSDGAVLVGVQREGAVELLRVPLDGGPPETLVDGPFTVRGFAAGGGVVVAVVAHDRSAGELIALTPGPPAAADRVRARGWARPAGCTGCASGRRRRPTATRCTAGSRRRPGPARTRCC